MREDKRGGESVEMIVGSTHRCQHGMSPLPTKNTPYTRRPQLFTFSMPFISPSCSSVSVFVLLARTFCSASFFPFFPFPRPCSPMHVRGVEESSFKCCHSDVMPGNQSSHPYAFFLFCHDDDFFRCRAKCFCSPACSPSICVPPLFL